MRCECIFNHVGVLWFSNKSSAHCPNKIVYIVHSCDTICHERAHISIDAIVLCVCGIHLLMFLNFYLIRTGLSMSSIRLCGAHALPYMWPTHQSNCSDRPRSRCGRLPSDAHVPFFDTVRRFGVSVEICIFNWTSRPNTTTLTVDWLFLLQALQWRVYWITIGSY